MLELVPCAVTAGAGPRLGAAVQTCPAGCRVFSAAEATNIAEPPRAITFPGPGRRHGPATVQSSLMPNSISVLVCVSCKISIQKATDSFSSYNDSNEVSAYFDNGDYILHCRGQGRRYNSSDSVSALEGLRIDDDHYNFSGYFKGACCFCALQGGFGSELFLTNACINCTRKETKLYTIDIEKGVVSWESHGWAALPSGILDNILRIFLGGDLLIIDGALLDITAVMNREDEAEW